MSRTKSRWGIAKRQLAKGESVAGTKRKKPAPSKKRAPSKQSNKKQKKNHAKEEDDIIHFSTEDGRLISQQPAAMPTPTTKSPAANATQTTKPPSRQIQRATSHSGTPPESPIEISDDSDDESEDGGITLNLGSSALLTKPIEISDDGKEEGEASQDDHSPTTPSDTEQPMFVLDANPITATTTTRLIDLNPDELEEQLRYAFYHMSRAEIDLNRLVRCISCFTEGHTSSGCPQTTYKPSSANDKNASSTDCNICHRPGHVESECSLRYSPFPKLGGSKSDPVRLWISCAGCASKQHLIGDCPVKSRTATCTARWSLKSVDSSSILNLNLQTTTRRAEREAASRGLRPPGSISVRGRATPQNNRYTFPSDSDESPEDFLSHPPSNFTRPSNNYRPDTRYDRFDPPTDRGDTYRPPRTEFYSTDSFGRSRSPLRQDDDLRSRTYRRRSPSPRADAYIPQDAFPRSNARRNQSPPRPGERVKIPLPPSRGRGGGAGRLPNRGAPTARKGRGGTSMMGNHRVGK